MPDWHAHWYDYLFWLGALTIPWGWVIWKSRKED